MGIFSKNNKFFNKKAFTLVELLVVISIIGILSSTVFASLSSARSRARDAIRKSDLAQIAKAFRLYYEQNGTYRIPNTGWVDDTGYATGVGHFNYDYDAAGPVVSVSQGLINAGLLPKDIRDPSGLASGFGNIGAAYMFYAPLIEQFTLWTSLENPSTSDTDTLSNCSRNEYDGYSIAYPANRRTNYCVSN